ncbi:MAG: substrate-binding domain-containing protein [Marinilabiliaceae bacterium]|nr:substrate-binding domain-containing protein [Marinilabiliaceae bacterium]
MKNISKIIGTLLILLLIVSCTTKPKVGFLMDSIENERWKKDKVLFEQKMRELGGKTVIKISDSDTEKQFKLAQEMLLEGVDVLVLIPSDLYDAKRIVDLYHKNDKPVISYDRLVRNCNVDFYISTDNIDVGELQANYLTKICPVGKYMLIGGATTDYNAYLLHLGWMNILQPLIDKGDITIINDEYTKDWSADEAYTITKQILSTENDLRAIIAGNDALANGAIKALKEKKINGETLVAGQDANIDAIRNIVAGDQTITIYKPIASMAHSAAQAAYNLANGDNPASNMSITINNGSHLIPSLLLKAQLVNKQNIKMTVVSEGFVAEQEIFE